MKLTRADCYVDLVDDRDNTSLLTDRCHLKKKYWHLTMSSFFQGGHGNEKYKSKNLNQVKVIQYHKNKIMDQTFLNLDVEKQTASEVSSLPQDPSLKG